VAAVTRPEGRANPWRRHLIRATVLGLAALLLASLPWLWTTVAARGHVHDEADAPAADVVIVLGTAVAADGRRPGTGSRAAWRPPPSW
jgi:vancomycin permeability regulator SanA